MNGSLLASTAHRPYPRPARPWIMAMQWRDLLFMHWRVEPGALRALVPDGLEVEAFDGSAWLGIVPFTMRGVRARWTPALPGLHAFHELNVRTYVRARADGRAGVWFFSLDAASRLAVRTARATFHLPYFDARMSLSRDDDSIRSVSARAHRGALPATLDATYRPTGGVLPASRPGSLEHFLTERYCLYAASRDRLYRGEIHHRPWPLQPASCEVRDNTMTGQIGVGLPEDEPVLHYARRLDVVAWWPKRVGDAGAEA